jgi:hypothetical protein
MSATAKDPIFENIKRSYNQTDFMDRYGTEVWVSAAIIVAFLSGTTYYSILNRIEPIKADWDNQKCHPAIIPIAGFIKKPKDMSALAFTAKNLGDCTYGTLVAIYQAAIQPFYYMLNNLNTLFAGLVEAMNNIRRMFDSIRNSMKDISTQMFNRVLALTVPLMSFMFNFRAILEKTVGVFTASVYTLLGGYITMKSLFGIIVELLIKILIVLFFITMSLFFIFWFVPIFGAWAGPLAFANVIIFIAIMIPVIYIKVFMARIMKMSTSNVPRVPGCFPGDTVVETAADGPIKAKDVKIGTRLKQGGVVQGTLRIDGREQEYYDLHGVVVTGQHRVWWNGRLMQVGKHPEARRLPDYDCDMVYCFITESKIIGIGKDVFCDWDEVDEDLLDILGGNAGFEAKVDNIHSRFESGLVGDTGVLMADGSTKAIKDVRINDVLVNGAVVKGLVEVQGDDLPLCMHVLKDSQTVLGSQNLHFIGQTSPVRVTLARQASPAKLYHVLTTKKTLPIAGSILMRDYNAGLDMFL